MTSLFLGSWWGQGRFIQLDLGCGGRERSHGPPRGLQTSGGPTQEGTRGPEKHRADGQCPAPP